MILGDSDMAATDERPLRMHRGAITTRQREKLNVDGDAMAGLVSSMR